MNTAATSVRAAHPHAPSGWPQGFRDYAVLGGILRSPLEFPELPPAAHGEPDWVLRVSAGPPPPLSAQLLGQREIGSERYTLSRSTRGFRLEYSHAGCFDISADGDDLCWYPNADASLELGRAIVLGPALSLALELRGCLCLHGSAVAMDGRALVFLGPKFHGKSTIATALTGAGASLISDDLLAVENGPTVRVRAGIPSVRLWQDAAAQLEVGRLCDTVLGGVKTTATGFTGRTMSAPDAPLEAIYILAPVAATEIESACTRTRLLGAHAAIALAHQTKLPPTLVGAAAAGTQLKLAAATAAAVPVWKLEVVRDFGRLAEVVGQLHRWHSTDDGAQGPELLR